MNTCKDEIKISMKKKQRYRLGNRNSSVISCENETDVYIDREKETCLYWL